MLSEDDERALCRHLALEPDKFEQVYCRWIPQDGVEQLSLKEKSNYDCIFWKDGCTVYEARPLSCRTYPFWRSMLVSREVWEAASAYCPGVRSGERHSGARIEECLSNEDAQVMVVRNRGRL
ncbi:zinc/iron-chelating domain-containing protein [Spirochaetia bacterium]|nr:zinc/iron-chelating domain-containing protein [Spirochaetia bacterium]